MQACKPALWQTEQSALDSCPWGPLGASLHCDVGARPGTGDLCTWYNWAAGRQCGLDGGDNRARAGIRSARASGSWGLEAQLALAGSSMQQHICLLFYAANHLPSMYLLIWKHKRTPLCLRMAGFRVCP